MADCSPSERRCCGRLSDCFTLKSSRSGGTIVTVRRLPIEDIRFVTRPGQKWPLQKLLQAKVKDASFKSPK